MQRPHKIRAIEQVEGEALMPVDEACHKVLPLLSNQIDIAKQKTESEINRLVNAFVALKREIQDINSLKLHSTIDGGQQAANRFSSQLEENVRHAIDGVPSAFSSILRHADDVMTLGDKMCAMGADVYQCAATCDKVHQKSDEKVAMKLIVAAFEVMEHMQNMQAKLRQTSFDVSALVKSLMSTIEIQGEAIEALRVGGKGADTKLAALPSVESLQKLYKNMDAIIEGFQFQDQVCQILDSVERSMQDFVEAIPKNGLEADTSSPMNVHGLMAKIKSHSVTQDQHRLMGTRGDDDMSPGETKFL